MKSLKEDGTEKAIEYVKDKVYDSEHDFAHKIFKMRNVYYEDGDEQWISFREDDKALRTNYNESSAMPVYFEPVDGQADTYILKNEYPDSDKQYISFANDGEWLYARYEKKEDAVPLRFKKCAGNDSGTFEGECYLMRSMWEGTPGKFVSFADDGTWLRITYEEESDAMRVVLVPQAE